MKLLKTALILIGMHFATQINAAEFTKVLVDHDKEIPTVHVTTPNYTARFIEPNDIEEIGRLCSASYPEGLPEDSGKWAENMIARRNNKNYYNCLVVSKADQIVAAVGLGRMPVLNYDPAFTDIIDTWLDFSVVKKKDPTSGYEKDNFERCDNAGIAFILPIIPTGLESSDKDEIIKLGTDVIKFFKDKGFLLPLENTNPHDLITLLSPADILGKNFTNAGFLRLEKEGYLKFYDKSRVMFHTVL